MKRLTGSQAFCLALERLGVHHIFGVPGTQNVALFEALRRSSVRTILPTHELAAGFMANGYYRASGKAGWLTTIPGPGFAYAVPAIAEASQDSTGLVFVVGKPASGPGQKFNLQAFDQKAVLAPLVKKIVEVDAANDMAGATYEAHRAATEGEPGPVLLHIDSRVLDADAAFEEAAPAPHVVSTIAADELEQIVRLLMTSQRVVILAGQGACDAARPLQELMEALNAPLITTRSARGVVPENHPLVLPSSFSDRTLTAVNSVLDRSDLILAIGCKLSHNGTYGFRLHLAKDKLIHVDASPEVLNANYPAKLAVTADASTVLDALCQTKELRGPRRDGWSAAELDRARQACAPEQGIPEPAIPGASPPTPAGFFDALGRAMPSNSCLVTDSGLHQVLATRHFRVLRPRGMMIPSDFQSMGFGVPAAIGAKLASPETTVVALTGDGGFAITAMEVVTAVRERIPVTIVVFNDGALGQIRLQQLASYGHSHATTLQTPDLELIAQALGAEYVRWDGETGQVLPAVLARQTVTIVEVAVGDSPLIRRERFKGLARGFVREQLPAGMARWIKSKLRA